MDNVIINYIANELTNETLDEALDPSDDLLGSGILDSMGMMKLILFVEEEFQVKVPPEDMIIENFMTVKHIEEYISKKE